MTVWVRTSFYLSVLLLVVAPFYYAGRTAMGVLFIQSIGLFLLFCISWGGLYAKKLFAAAWGYLFISIALALLYVVPIPVEMWRELPGREFYANTFDWLGTQGVELNSFPLSIVPSETILSLFMLIPGLAIFLSAVSLPQQQIRRLVYVFLFVASIQGALGLIQYASDDPFFVFGLEYSGRQAQGLYANRDHFAALMVMALPLALGLMLFSVGRGDSDRQSGGSGFQANELFIFIFASLLIFLAAIFTRSRAGVFLVLLMFLLSSILFSRHIGGKRAASWVSAFVVMAGGLAVTVGLAPVLNRFLTQDPLEDGRWPIFETSMAVIDKFFPLGSGPGTFAEVYVASQPVEQAFYANHAHNDYLELVVEMGAAGAFVIAGFLLLYLYGWVRLRKHDWNRMRFLQVGAGLSVFGILLHCLLDFILHTPANLVVFAFLVGVFLRPKELTEHRRSRR